MNKFSKIMISVFLGLVSSFMVWITVLYVSFSLMFLLLTRTGEDLSGTTGIGILGGLFALIFGAISAVAFAVFIYNKLFKAENRKSLFLGLITGYTAGSFLYSIYDLLTGYAGPLGEVLSSDAKFNLQAVLLTAGILIGMFVYSRAPYKLNYFLFSIAAGIILVLELSSFAINYYSPLLTGPAFILLFIKRPSVSVPDTPKRQI
ncbi:hypothetical protein [Bacillus infantis]|uniref:hypothetical protein n=1 Tax=Bacillus infantis TaxID=324767 RepID=UPI003CEE6620